MRSLCTVALALALFAPAIAEARPRPAGRALGSPYTANKTFGLGLELGNVEGLTGKLFVGDTNALDFGVGYLYGFRAAGLHIYADYLWHPFSLTSQPAFELPFYIGVGGRFWNFDDHNSGIDVFGIRVPIGISFDLNNVPIDIFIQAVPTLDFFRHYAHDAGIDVDVSVGIRFYFN